MPPRDLSPTYTILPNTFFQSVLCLYSVNIVCVQFYNYWNESAIARHN